MKHSIVLNQSTNNWDEQDKAMIVAFLEYLFQELTINDVVTIKLEHDAKENQDIGVKINLRLAYVDLDNRLIVIYCKNRGLMDILRSIAHELIHVQQKDLGLLGDSPNIPFYLPNSRIPGYEFEYEAYGLSGILVRNFRAVLNGALDEEQH